MKQDPRLEKRLREWAARREPAAERLDALAAQIISQVQQEPLPRATPAERRIRWAYAVAGALVMALACFAWHGLRERQADRPVRTLYLEASRLFPNQLRWLAQTDGEVGLGVESANPDAIPPTPPVLLKLTVLTRDSPKGRWREAWTTEIIARTEDLLEIAPSRLAGNRLTLWVYGLEHGKLALETDLRLERPIKLASRLNTVVNSQEPVETVLPGQGRAEYKVIQVVEPLEDGSS